MSSPLLIDEPPLQVLPSLAVAVGLNEALILQQVHYWIQAKRKAPERYQESFKQGEWWVYNSVPEWNAQFPFWGDNTIRRALSSLRELGLLIAGQLAPDPRDKTLWYRIDYDKLDKTTALHHAPKGTAKKKFDSNIAEIESETKWADASTQNGQMDKNGQMASSGSTQNGQVHQSKMGRSHLPKAGSSHPPKMGKTLTETSSENSQRIPQKTDSEFSASLFEGKEPEPDKVPVSPSWSSLPEAEQQPYIDQATGELQAACEGVTLNPLIVEVRGRNLYHLAHRR